MQLLLRDLSRTSTATASAPGPTAGPALVPTPACCESRTTKKTLSLTECRRLGARADGRCPVCPVDISGTRTTVREPSC